MTPIRPGQPSDSGFTLIELMIVLVIAAVLLGVALPSYRSAVREGRRSDAYDASVGVLQAQERWRGDHLTYTATLSDLMPSANSAGGLYSLALSSASARGYTLTLTGLSAGGQASDTGCATLTVTVLDGDPSYSPAACWKK